MRRRAERRGRIVFFIKAREPGLGPPVDAVFQHTEVTMGRGILLWLVGVPIPIIILLALVWR